MSTWDAAEQLTKRTRVRSGRASDKCNLTDADLPLIS